MEFIVTCPKGLEQSVAQELECLRVRHIRPLTARVAFEDSLESAYRVVLWSHVASRVIAVLGRISAEDADTLYQQARELPWEDTLLPRASFAIAAHGTNAKLRNSQFVAQRLKDAIVDRIAQTRGVRPQVDTFAPDLLISAQLSGERLTLGIDLAGGPLFMRGYEPRRSGVVPLRADIAAAMLLMNSCVVPRYPWSTSPAEKRSTPPQSGTSSCKESAPDNTPQPSSGPAPLLIIGAGAGTLLTEAISLLMGVSPARTRRTWGHTGWSQHDHALWDRLYAQTQQPLEVHDALPTLWAYDPRPAAATDMRQLTGAAGFHNAFTLLHSPADIDDTFAQRDARIVLDMSWLHDDQVALEAHLLSITRRFASHQLTALSRGSALIDILGRSASQQHKLIVGQSEASLNSFDVTDAHIDVPEVELPVPQGSPLRVPVLMHQSDQFARRLSKAAKQLGKWARTHEVSCYRVYDADLPDYAVAIDLYQTIRGERHLNISEYAAPKTIDADKAHKRLLDVLTLAPQILSVPSRNVHMRIRTRAKGGSQYAHYGQAQINPSAAQYIDENGLEFEINFSGRLDPGIFLDHRDTRSELREMAKEQRGRFLNLFAYTGTASCYAADGGATATTTVDLSGPSLAWAERNMKRNGFVGPQHQFIQADVLQFIQDKRHGNERWDLIFCDVPTFSNSSRMRQSSFDVQRDHVELLIGLSRLLTPQGVAIFSCNATSFTIHTEELKKARVQVEDISARTIPHDFERHSRIHQTYLVRLIPLR